MSSISACRHVARVLALVVLLHPSAATAQRPPDSLRVPILVYHNIQPAAEAGRIRAADLTMPPEAFAAQMQYLKDHNIPVVSLGALVDALEGTRTLPPNAVVITFDDGRLNQYQHAVPVLKKHGFTATFFPFTHAMDRNPRYMTWAQLRELQAAGFTVGSHTSLHVRVDRMKDAKQMHAEVTGSRERLAEKLGANATEFLAYPFGVVAAAGDSAVRAAGYRAARAYNGKVWNGIANRWRLNAVAMTEHFARFVQIVEPNAPRPVRNPGKQPPKHSGAPPGSHPGKGPAITRQPSP